ncbi:hypothetical protein K0U27_05065 [archaeon]|nr:hypothetical protein [archaeon]
MKYKNLAIFSAVVLAIIGTSIGYLTYEITEENGRQFGYNKTILKNGTDTLVCDKVFFRPPFNCQVVETRNMENP